MYKLTHTAYCGMHRTVDDADCRTEARAAAASYLRSARRRGYPVTTLARGSQWEILEPEGAAMVPDGCGVLTLRRETFECRECGCMHDTREDHDACCGDFWADYVDTEATDDAEA